MPNSPLANCVYARRDIFQMNYSYDPLLSLRRRRGGGFILLLPVSRKLMHRAVSISAVLFH